MSKRYWELIKAKAENENWGAFSTEYLEGFRNCLCLWLSEVDGNPCTKPMTKKEQYYRILGALRGISGVMKERGKAY